MAKMKDYLKPHKTTADPTEVAHFNALAAEWWNPNGAFKGVHAFNHTRVAYLAQKLPDLLAKPCSASTALDVGCGAGLVAEAMDDLGLTVTGLDAAEQNIRIARTHAARNGRAITYHHMLAETLASDGAQFDLVLSLEVVEHVADVATFLKACTDLVKPGGTLIVGTLNRTPQSFVKAIIGAEYILKLLPKGTHDWRKFVKPAELDDYILPAGFTCTAMTGVNLNPITRNWSIGRATDTTYLRTYKKQP